MHGVNMVSNSTVASKNKRGGGEWEQPSIAKWESSRITARICLKYTERGEVTIQHTHTHIHTRAYTHAYTRAPTDTYRYTERCTRTHMHTCTHTRTRTQKETHAPQLAAGSEPPSCLRWRAPSPATCLVARPPAKEKVRGGLGKLLQAGGVEGESM